MVYRVKKTKNYTVISNYYLRDERLSLRAIGLLTKMLSFPPSWKFNARSLAYACMESYHVVRGVIGELEDTGYIVRRQKRTKRGQWSSADYDIYEIPLELAKKEGAELEADAATKTAKAKPNVAPETPPPDAPELDAAALNRYRAEIRENIDYERLWRKKGADLELLSGYVELMAEVCAGGETIRVNGREVSAKEAERRFLSLDANHILYAMDCLKDTRSEIRNIRAYTLATLYNTPNTIDQYYKSKIASDRAELKDEDD